MLFKEYSINQFMEELISDAPSPGGGSTAALVAGLGAGLNSMVYSLTVDRKSFEALSEEKKKQMRKFQEQSKEFNKISQEFMDKDREDFVALMSCYRLPKESEEEKQIRKKCIREKTINAMNTPLNLARECMKFYDNIKFAVMYGNKNLISDGGVAAILLHSAIESAILNVKVNLNFLRQEDFVKCIEDECDNITNKSNKFKDSILSSVQNTIYPK